MKIYLKTYGCKVNQYESEKIRYNLLQNGHKFVSNYKDSDIIIINSCIVTAKSEKKNVDLIKKIKQSNPDKKLIVAGCLVEKNCIKEADLNINNDNKIKKILEYFNIKTIKNIAEYEKQTRAFLKIQDGCNQYCSYCIIPYLRDEEKNFDFNGIIDEANDLALNNYKEIVLTGIHLGKYDRLASLMKEISKIDKIKRIRLSSIQINEINDEIVNQIKSNKKVMPHLHISLQSGSNKILKKMNRPYSKEYYIDKVKEIQKKIPEIGITTDVIVGFPKETDKDFRETVDVLKKLNIHRVHVFPFSKRKNTKAYRMKGDIDNSIKSQRARIIRKLSKKLFENFVTKFLGEKLNVLVESSKNQASYGYSENYLRCKIESDIIKSNEIVEIKVKSYNSDKRLVITEKV